MARLEVGKKYWIKTQFLGELSGPVCGADIPKRRYAFRIGELKTPTCIDFSVEDFEALEASPERDKVKIDRHMDVYITAAKENGLTLQKGLSDFKPKNSEIFARAWLDGYEVEEPLGVLLVDMPCPKGYEYHYLGMYDSQSYTIFKTNRYSELKDGRNTVRVTEAEAKEKYPNFKWVSFEELE